MISAQVICDSISEQGKRLTTFKLRYPKFIHGEFMTHRVISRNASSSRAIPSAKLIEEVRSDALRAVPEFWGKNQKGMQDGGELSGVTGPGPSYIPNRRQYIPEHGFPSAETYKDLAKEVWRNAAFDAAERAEELVALGAHKQIVNRILEPFSHINVVATATEWENFFGLRLDKGADPTMRALAVAMWEARKASESKTLQPGEWHLPFVDGDGEHWSVVPKGTLDVAIKVSVARCARVSYQSFETGKRSTVEEDLKLYDRLLGSQPLHASPAEHQATPDEHLDRVRGLPYIEWANQKEWGNFVGWRQYRKMLPNEAIAPIPDEFLPF